MLNFYRYGLIFLAMHSLVFAMDIPEFKQTWTYQALSLQRQLDIDAPFNQTQFFGTHNSYNSQAYRIDNKNYLDPNHTLSITDQLELGVRSLEFDAHWFMGKNGKKEFLLCHGLDNHLGCSMFDRPFVEGLKELKIWLTEHPKEVILLYIEKHVDHHETELANIIQTELTDFIFTPVTNGLCQAIPEKLTKTDILKAGRQLILVTKGCAFDAPFWNDTVFAGIGAIPTEPFTFLDSTIGSDFFPYPDCSKTTIYSKDPDHTSLWRLFEDRTRLSNSKSPTRKLLPEDMKMLLKCDINWPAVDMLEVNDPRIAAAVWSWASNFPQDGLGSCAELVTASGFQNVACGEEKPAFVCMQEKTRHFDLALKSGNFSQGEKICQSTLGATWHFGVPANASEMNTVKTQAMNFALSSLWVNYHVMNGQWLPNV